MKKKVKYVLAGIIVAVIIGVVVFSTLRPMTVSVLYIEPNTAVLYFEEQGFVRSNNHSVYSLDGGMLLYVNAQEGQAVARGDVLAVVDSSDLFHEIEQIRINNLIHLIQIDNLSAEAARTREGQIADRNSMQGELNAINAQEQIALISQANQQQAKEESLRLQYIHIEQSRNDVQAAEEELTRAQTLYDAGIISGVELQNAIRILEVNEAAFYENIQRLEIIRNETLIIDQSQYFESLRSSVLAQISGINNDIASDHISTMIQYYNSLIEGGERTIANLERRIDERTIVSPVDGIIVRLNIDSTNVLNTLLPVAEIMVEEDDLIEVFVSTADINAIQVGDSVDLMFNHRTDVAYYTGVIYSIGVSAESRISVLGVEERRVAVLIKPDVEDSSFRSGFDVSVRFTTYSSQDRIVVPRTAVFFKNGQSMLYIVDNGRVLATPVQLGNALRTEIIIESGLNFGDLVIRDAGQDGLRDGARVAY
ncbi:MAG: HlyD family efflux transporter periplasmic adaptor subunit [Defluviitaleaceae bacterium]|nr:HlyD family efflux transporter periplasmic adaptor subunit [Defluviitaleaceae bacterium]